MEYVNYGKTGLKVSRFGLGCMRFPQDEQDAIAMVRYAIDHGVNYLDTAYVYGNSEVIVGKALKDGYRAKTNIATKSPIFMIQGPADFERCLDEELVRLGTDHIDVYLLHNLGAENWDKVKRFGGIEFLDRMIQKGKILHKGFSVHNTLDAYKEILNASSSWEMAQIQLNILDEKYQAGVEGLKYGAAKGIATVIMEPLRGGNLVNNVPPEVTELINSYSEKRSLAEWCFRWLYNMSEATVILSGCSALDQLKDNLRIFEDAKPNVMSPADLDLIKKIREVYESKVSIRCTGCRYCMPCPNDVEIPEIFKLFNSLNIVKGGNGWNEKALYMGSFVGKGKGADKCVECHQCEEHCPQNLKIPDLLKDVHAELSKAPAGRPPPPKR
jgi:predicted aldo/keto reductase-like oxidoreductase